jgi:diguanylate cyclase (GGDEF)-like protein
MEIQRLFKLIKSLTQQTNLRDLITALNSLLDNNFKNVELVVYELLSTRVDNNKSQCLICVDCLGNAESILLSDESDFSEAYIDKEEVYSKDGKSISKVTFPVVLYDKSISHLITIKHAYKDKSATELLIGLMQIFTDVFRSLHEKGYDPLTRILNRQAFDQVVTDLALSKNRLLNDSDKQYKAIAILDIDKFKSINDQYGHAIGDETLVLFAQTIRAVLRQEDLFFRYGGEEFVVLVKEVHIEQAHNVLERCRAAIEIRRFPQVGQVTVSIGFSDLDADSHPIENLSKADKALYYIKNNGRNQVQSYEQLLAEELLEPVEPIEGAIDFWD